MLHLLQLEWKKQKGYILFKVLLISYVLLLPSVLMIGKKLNLSGSGLPFNPQVMLYQFPTVWEWLAYVGNWMVFFVLGFLAVLLVTNEHAYRTLRQNVITGLHRSEFFQSKLLFMVAVALFATLYYALCALAIGLLNTETLYFDTVFKNWDLVPRYFLMSMGYMSFGLLVAVLVKRTGIALFVFLGYSMFLEPVLRYTQLYFWKNQSMNFYPLNVFEDLCPFPFTRQADFFLKENGFYLFLTPAQAVIASTIYIAIFLFLSFRKLKTSDL
ncbi:MAG: hypothetical protein R2830_07295 [Saprospiraceae bacterium]